MFHLRVIADKLNIRNTAMADPTFANWIGDSLKDELHFAEKKIKGGVFEEVDDWYVDEQKRFYWAGGVVEIPMPEVTSTNIQLSPISEKINMTLSSTTLVDFKDISQLPFMQNLQGNIIKGHGRDHTANLFLQFKDAHLEQVKEKLHELGEELTSFYKQLFERELFKKTGKNISTFCGAYLTAEGYKYLGYDLSHFSDNAFIDGLSSRGEILNDPAKHKWECGYRKEIHLMVLLANDDANELTSATSDLLKDLDGICHVLHIEYGHVLRNANNDGIEHFGYADGISQPLFLKDEVDDYWTRHNCPAHNQHFFDPSARLEIALIKDPFPLEGYEENSFGSYLVYRKLEQNVREFKETEGGLLNNNNKKLGEIAGGYLVGRFEDGTPVAISPGEGLIEAGNFNNFSYAQDQAGLKCPHFAHIRVTNNRTFTGESENRTCFNKHSIVRRGIPFGYRSASPTVELHDAQYPVNGVGLLFMCFQASIEEQFEKMQIAANTPTTSNQSDIDPIIGQPKSCVKPSYAFPHVYGQQTVTSCQPFGSFVEMKGGAYFFAPSIQFFKNI